MNLILDALPLKADINGKSYPVNTDFRAAYRYAVTAQSNLPPKQFILQALRCFFGRDYPTDKEAALDWIDWFYKADAVQLTAGKGKQGGPTPISFEHDAGRIYASFMAVYGLDLTSVDYLHWWKYKALFDALPDDCEIMKIVGFRAAKIDPKMSKSQQEYLRKMKELYAIPLSERDQQLRNELVNVLKNGGDVRSVLGG